MVGRRLLSFGTPGPSGPNTSSQSAANVARRVGLALNRLTAADNPRPSEAVWIVIEDRRARTVSMTVEICAGSRDRPIAGERGRGRNKHAAAHHYWVPLEATHSACRRSRPLRSPTDWVPIAVSATRSHRRALVRTRIRSHRIRVPVPSRSCQPRSPERRYEGIVVGRRF